MSDTEMPRHVPLIGVTAYEQALDEVIERAERELRVFDRTLGSGFNSAARCDALRRFLLASRRNRLRFIVHEPAHLDRNCPRLLRLLRDFTHAVSINETLPQAKLVYDAFTVADEQHFVRRFHQDQPRGVQAMHDPIEARSLIERFEEIWEASAPAVSATTLGL